MRTLSEIIENAKSGEMPTHEECYYAMLVYEFLYNMDHRTLREALMPKKPLQSVIAEMKAQNSHDMYRKALERPPKDYLGWENDPKNLEYQKQREVSLRIFEKALKGELPNQNND